MARVLITAGPTREPIDAVRFISNRSSGRVGVALAEAAVAAGHATTLLLGPTAARPSITDAELVRFDSTADLQEALEAHFPACDVLLMAAAVADYRPAVVQRGKLERQAGGTITLELAPTPDLVAGLAAQRRRDQRIVAFALEQPQRLEARALAKMQRKGVDAILANPLGTMEAEAIEPTLLWADGRIIRPGPMPKADFGPWLIARTA
jgi:phosphopantothenoylcysteine decarboxylase/phosphopantothenate--cysteine ligase